MLTHLDPSKQWMCLIKFPGMVLPLPCQISCQAEGRGSWSVCSSQPTVANTTCFRRKQYTPPVMSSFLRVVPLCPVSVCLFTLLEYFPFPHQNHANANSFQVIKGPAWLDPVHKALIYLFLIKFLFALRKPLPDFLILFCFFFFYERHLA